MKNIPLAIAALLLVAGGFLIWKQSSDSTQQKSDALMFFAIDGDHSVFFEGGPVSRGEQGKAVADYEIDFGDSTSGGIEYLWQSCPAMGECVREPIDEFQASHQYERIGTYTASLLKNGRIVATTSVVVTDNGREEGRAAGPFPGEE